MKTLAELKEDCVLARQAMKHNPGVPEWKLAYKFACSKVADVEQLLFFSERT